MFRFPFCKRVGPPCRHAAFFEQMGIRNARAFNGFGDTISQAESENAVELTVAFEHGVVRSGVTEMDRAKLGLWALGAHGKEEEEEPEEEEPETGEPEELPEALVGVARGPAGAAAELAPLWARPPRIRTPSVSWR